MADNEELHIALSFDENFITPFYVLITSIFKNNNSKIKFHLLTTGLSDLDKNEIKEIILNNKGEVEFYHIDNSFKAEDFVIPEGFNATVATYYKLFLPLVIPRQVKRVLYLDVDIVVIGELNQLFRTDLKEYPVGAVTDNVVDLYDSNNILLPKLGINNKGCYFNAGVLLIDLNKWKDQKISERTIDFIKNNAEIIWFVDQDGLNAILKDNWFKLDKKYNVTTFDVTNDLPIREIIKDTTIIHYTTGNKPWKYLCENRFRTFYQFYFKLSPHKNKPLYVDSISGLKRNLQHFRIKLNDRFIEFGFFGRLAKKMMLLFSSALK